MFMLLRNSISLFCFLQDRQLISESDTYLHDYMYVNAYDYRNVDTIRPPIYEAPRYHKAQMPRRPTQEDAATIISSISDALLKDSTSIISSLNENNVDNTNQTFNEKV